MPSGTFLSDVEKFTLGASFCGITMTCCVGIPGSSSNLPLIGIPKSTTIRSVASANVSSTMVSVAVAEG